MKTKNITKKTRAGLNTESTLSDEIGTRPTKRRIESIPAEAMSEPKNETPKRSRERTVKSKRDSELASVFSQIQRLAARRDQHLKEAAEIDAARLDAVRRMKFLLATREPIIVEIRYDV